MNKRIAYLDGHRGVAILLVVFFHAYARWPEVVPYGKAYEDIVLFKYGWLGVELFFLISGYVILMSLERCNGIKEFLFRRWIRLFPAMLFCSIIIFYSASYFVERPAGQPILIGLLPGLTFIEPSWWEFLLKKRVIPIEGAFWSLYVEFKFYLFAVFIFYWFGRNWLIASLVLVNILAILVRKNNYFIIDKTIINIIENLSFQYFGWFAAGASFYIYKKTSNQNWFYISIVISIFNALFVRELEWRSTMAAFVVSMFFAISLISNKIQYLLNINGLQFFGFISYPLYLLHENMMISMIVKVGFKSLMLPAYLFPIMPILILSIFAYFIARYIETNVKKIIISAGNVLKILYKQLKKKNISVFDD